MPHSEKALNQPCNVVLAAALFGLWLASGRAAPGQEPAQKGAIEPDWAEAELCAGDRCFPVGHVREASLREWMVGDRRLQIGPGKLLAIDSDHEVLWRSDVEATERLSFLAEHAGIAYLSVTKEHDESEGDDAVEESRCRVRRLVLQDGTWLTDLEVPSEGDEKGNIHRLVAAISAGDGVVFLSVAEKPDFPENLQVSYRLSRFGTGWDWSRVFQSNGTVPGPTAFLLGSRGPVLNSASIRHLSMLGSHVLVCAGPFDDLMAVDPTTGERVWRVSKLWEYRRGFIGPSVWSYFLDRYGMEDHHVKLASLTPEELRAQSDKGTSIDEEYLQSVREAVREARERVESQLCFIVAGPVIVPLPGEEGGHSIFVVTARSDSRTWPSYLADCVIYEVDASGNVIGTATVPRLVNGSQHHIQGLSVYWRSSGGGHVRLHASPQVPGAASLSGNDDMTIDVEMQRGPAAELAEAWLRQGVYYDVAAFHGRYMVCANEGGFLQTKDSTTLTYPLVLVDLEAGKQQKLTLKLPFSGRVVRPSVNILGSDEGWVALGEYLVMIRRLEFYGDRLLVTFTEDDSSMLVEFDVNELVR